MTMAKRKYLIALQKRTVARYREITACLGRIRARSVLRHLTTSGSANGMKTYAPLRVQQIDSTRYSLCLLQLKLLLDC